MKRWTVYSHLKTFYVVLCVVFSLGTIGHSQELDSHPVWELCAQQRSRFERFAASLMWNIPAHTTADDIVDDACLRMYKAVEKGTQPIDTLKASLFTTIERVVAPQLTVVMSTIAR